MPGVYVSAVETLSIAGFAYSDSGMEIHKQNYIHLTANFTALQKPYSLIELQGLPSVMTYQSSGTICGWWK